MSELKRRIAKLERDLHRWRGCPACHQDHPADVMCPPHEVRTTGQAWFRERVLTLERELEAERDKVTQLREALKGADWIISKLAPHEALAIAVRGYRPSGGDIVMGRRYRKMIDDALAEEDSK